MSYLGSPALDLCYLLFTSSSEQIRARDWNELIEFYITEMENLAKWTQNAMAFSRQEFERVFLDRAIFGAAFCLFTIPMRSIEHPTKDSVMKFLDASESSQQFRHEIYSRTTVKGLLKTILLYFVEKKIF